EGWDCCGTVRRVDLIKEVVRSHKPAQRAAGAAGQKSSRESLIDRAAIERHQPTHIAVRAASHGTGGVGLRNDSGGISGHRTVECDQSAKEAVIAAADRAGRKALAYGSDIQADQPAGNRVAAPADRRGPVRLRDRAE